MNFNEIASRYLVVLQRVILDAQASGQMTDELSYRPCLHQFFTELCNAINPEIVLVYEPKNQARAGKPDWRFHNRKTLGVYGYAEAKGLNLNTEIRLNDYQEQIERYKGLGNKLIVTDGIDFCFIASDGSHLNIPIVEKPISVESLNSQSPNFRLEQKLQEFLADTGFHRVSEEQLINEVARRAKVLARDIRELSSSPRGAGLNERENQLIDALHQLKTLLKNHHDLTLGSDKAFGDFVSQVLIFGLLFAHRIIRTGDDEPTQLYEKIKQFWTSTVYATYSEKLKPFKGLVEILGEELNTLGPLGTWYQDCLFLLSHIQLEEKQLRQPDYHILFERFLEVFDPQVKFDFGAYYTPRALSSFTVSLVDAIVCSELGMSIFNRKHKLIDPCCGTGSFLEQLVLKSPNICELGTLSGFEIMPGPYALAHYRMTMLKQERGEEFESRVVLTNTLSDELEREEKDAPSNIIEIEQDAARVLSRPPLTLVLGNPPVSNSQERTEGKGFRRIFKLLEDFRPPTSQRTDRQNIQKQITNEFMKFLRWSCDKLMDSPIGIFALVLPRSFGDRESYQYSRKWLFENFQKFWVIDLDLDIRSGVNSSNIFKTAQGRMLLIGIRGLSKDKMFDDRVFHYDITNLNRDAKLDSLGITRTIEEYMALFHSVSSVNMNYELRPHSKRYDTTFYESFYPLYSVNRIPEDGERYIFKRNVSGVKLAPSTLLVHVSKPHLIRRCREIADNTKTVQEIKATWFDGQTRLPDENKFSLELRRVMKKAIENNKISRYAYRPFLTVYALIDEECLDVLSNTGGGGTRSRPELLSAYSQENTIGLAVAPSPSDVAENLHRFVSFCWHLPDNDLCRRQNAHIFCNQFPEYKKKKDWNNQAVTNVNTLLIESLNRTIVGVSANDVVYYSYAILCSNAYLDAFEDALFTAADYKNCPRIPFTTDMEVFTALLKFGRELALLENMEIKVALSPKFEVFRDLVAKPFSLRSTNIDNENESLHLFGVNGEQIIINPIDKEILSFQVSGYNVIKKWIDYHSSIYTRMEFDAVQFEELLDVLERINRQLNIIKSIDDLVSKILAKELPLA